MIETFLQNRSYRVITHVRDILLEDNGQSYLLDSNNEYVNMEAHVQLVEMWKQDQKMTNVQTAQDKKDEEERRSREDKDSYHHGRGERKYSNERSKCRRNEWGPGDRYQNWDCPRRQVVRAPSAYNYSEGSGNHRYEEIDQDELQRNESFGLANHNRISKTDRPVVSIHTKVERKKKYLEKDLSSARSSQSRHEYRGVQSNWDCPFSGDNFMQSSILK